MSNHLTEQPCVEPIFGAAGMHAMQIFQVPVCAKNRAKFVWEIDFGKSQDRDNV